MKEIPLTGKYAFGRVTLIDDEDYETVSAYRWRIAKTIQGKEYVVAYIPNPDRIGKGMSNYGLHTLITGFSMVDHRNGDTLDNRRENLREATYCQNSANRPAHKRTCTGYKGVNRSNGRWQARIMKEGKRKFLGNFDTPEEAARAYDVAARELHGDFAWLNFP